jgi:hypothetical protein
MRIQSTITPQQMWLQSGNPKADQNVMNAHLRNLAKEYL